MDGIDELTLTSQDEGRHLLANVLDGIRTFPHLPTQERRVVLRELVATCNHADLQVLQRLLGQTTHSGFDPVSILPLEISHNILLHLSGMDLVRCRAVCRPWREMIQGDSALWRAKVQAWDAAECLLLKDNVDDDEEEEHVTEDSEEQDKENEKGQGSRDDLTATTAITTGQRLDRIANTSGFRGWEATLVRELALQHNWYQGQYTHETTLTLNRNIKPVLLNWPILIVVDDFSRVFSIDLLKVREGRHAVIPVWDTNYTNMFQPQAYGAISCVAWDSTRPGKSSTRRGAKKTNKSLEMEPLSIKDEEGTDATKEVTESEQETPSYPLALGGYLRSIQMCDPTAGKSVVLPEVLHGFPLHICFMREHVLSVTLDGHITFFRKGLDFRPVKSCTVDTKVIQVAVVSFGSKGHERTLESTGATFAWKEAVCFAHEDGVIIKDENARQLCQVQLDLGARLLQFQALVDQTPPYRNELLILYEEPLTRQRVVLKIEMSPGYEHELARVPCPHTVSAAILGRGGDARDSLVMYRDRVGIVSHRNCSSDLGHYCTLRLVDTRENRVLSTEFVIKKSSSSSNDNDDDDDDDGGDGEVEGSSSLGGQESDKSDADSDDKENDDATAADRGKDDQGLPRVDRKDSNMIKKQQQQKHPDTHRQHGRRQHRKTKASVWIQKRGKTISLSDLSGDNKAACRILAMDHARLVLGLGPKIVKILYLV
ncbi:hypothetical protein BGZ83_005832 [Gryganskiella cystojenkinii]|nr:hypothetical protein BGZ83_005832 [Gryganskiella cystojenkinii]